MGFSISQTVGTVTSIALNTAMFVVIQGMLTRIAAPSRLLRFSSATFLSSTALYLCLAYLIAGSQFSSLESFLNCSVIVFVGSFGLCGLYTFLGPATADRSATAHLLMFMSENGRPLEIPAVSTAFDAAGFVEKRIAECQRAGIIQVDNGSLRLTLKGRRLAAVFSWMRATLKLNALPGYSPSFRLTPEGLGKAK